MFAQSFVSILSVALVFVLVPFGLIGGAAFLKLIVSLFAPTAGSKNIK